MLFFFSIQSVGSIKVQSVREWAGLECGRLPTSCKVLYVCSSLFLMYYYDVKYFSLMQSALQMSS